MKKTFTLLVALFVTVILQAQTPPSNYPGHGASSGDAYLIASLDNLRWLANQVNSGTDFTNIYFKQTADIDASVTGSGGVWGTEGWLPIGGAADFTGSYDGQNHIISGLYINRTTTDYVGLFGSIAGATIQNLGVTNVSITGQNYVGGLTGYFSGGSTVTNCYTTGSVTGLSGNTGGLIGMDDAEYLGANITVSQSHSSCTVSGTVYVGGLIGNAFSTTLSFGTISDCHSSGSVTGNSLSVGGLIGSTGSYGSVTNCYATGAVTTSGAGSAGGLIGSFGSQTMNNCYATGSVTSPFITSANVGGLIGYSSAGTVSNCYATGSVSAGTTYVSGSLDYSKSIGGLIGYSASTVSGCFATGTTYGGSEIGGLIGNSNGTVSDCYASGTITDNGKEGDDGGLIGSNSSTVSKCYTLSSITNVVALHGGFVGQNTGTINNNNFWNTNIYTPGVQYGTGTFSAVGKTTAQMQTTSTYSGWNFATTWNRTDTKNNKYPYLAWQILPSTATITTTAISTYDATSATMGGNVTVDGGATVTERGVVYSSTDATPTIGETGVTKDANGTGIGTFSKSTTGLSGNTTHYVCAYATNAAGTSYGSVVSFTTNVLTVSWNGTAWSPSAPTSLDNVIIDDTYSGAGFSCHDLTINAGKQVTISSGTLAVGGNLTLKSDAANGTATLINSGTLTVGGTTSVEQYLSSTRNWYVSSPLSGANAPSGYNYFQYNEPGDNTSYTSPATAYWKSVNAGDGLAIGRGYIAQLASGTSTITFTGGTLNTGDKTLSLTRTAGKDKEGFNLIGNPYPSYLNIDDLKLNTDIEPTYWYRSKATNYVFDTYNIPSGMTTGNSGLAVTANIPPMQAFWLRVTSGKSTASVVLKNANRGHQDNSNNKFRAPAASNATQKILRLQVSNGTNSDEAVVYFNQNAADEFDAYDSEKMSNNNATIPELYTLAGTEKAVINGLNKVTPNKELALGFTTGETNTFTIKATEIGNFDTDTKIILKDKLLNTEQELTAATDYSFSSDPVSTASRFCIVFRSASTVTGIDNSTDSKLNLTVFRNANGYITITRNDALGEGTVTVSNALGQKLADCSTTGTTTVVARSFLPGVYLVTVNVSGRTTTKKIILN